jgi:hypothetical protein
MSHAILAPSSAPVWGFCSGSIIAAQAAPSPETEQTRNGTAAHWVASECLDAWRRIAPGVTFTPSDYIGKTAPNGVVIDPTMAEGADVYVTDVIGTLTDHPQGRGTLLVEKRVEMPAVHPNNWGTLDAASRLNHRIYIWDYKNGHGKVGAFENLQMIDYLEGLRNFYQIKGHDDQNIEVIARVVQPFAYDPKGPISEWRFKLCDIRGYIKQLHMKAHEAMTAPTLTSGKHCRYCPARGRCPALREAAYNLIDVFDAPLAFDTMAGGDLATERAILLRGQSMIKGRLEAIEDDLKHRVKNGDSSTGLALESVQGSVKWAVGPEQAIASVGLLGVDIRRPHCDTPTQARAKVPAAMRGHFDTAIKAVSKRKSTLKLINAGDTMAARVFGR